jgi:hypothetical protein
MKEQITEKVCEEQVKPMPVEIQLDCALQKYERLKTAVQDLLCELRIDSYSLKFMANGYSPDYPGAETIDKTIPDKSHTYFCCKVQLSKIVAQKLLIILR